MIFDRLTNHSQYKIFGEKIKQGFDFLLKNDLETMKDGRYSILGDEICANIQTIITKPKEDKKWEVHRKYIDIQYLIKGSEAVGYGILEDFETDVPYDIEKDIAFLKTNKSFNYVNLNAGDFVIFYPNDVHSPMLAVCNAEEIKKAIVKIRI